MKDYIALDNYTGLGTMGISRRVLASIASKATASVAGASLSKRESRLFQISRPVKVALSHEGKAEIKIEVNLKKGAKVQDICLKIQQEVASQIAMMCEIVPIEIKIKVARVA
jgi:uncharacterized alkaline shock family protein YloU